MPSGPRGGDALDAALDDRDALGYVFIGRGPDPTLRYLTGRGFDTTVVYVRVAGESHLRVPSTIETPEVPGVAVRIDDKPAGKAAAAVLGSEATSGTVLVPQTIPHDAALHLESAGYDLASTPVLDNACAVKDDDERAAIETVQRAARRGIARAAEILADATVDNATTTDDDADATDDDTAHTADDDGTLVWDGAPLSTERIRRQVNVALAIEGVDAAGATTVDVGGRERSGETTPEDDASAVVLRADDPVVVSVAPRGRDGYRGALARTFVVDADGGWERRAHVACDAARDVALVEAGPGADAAFVGSEIRAETAAFGFSPSEEVARDVGGGIGLSLCESPPLDGDTELSAGNVIRVRTAVSDPENGRIELVDVMAIDDDGPVFLGDPPTSLDPAAWSQ
ncbi:Xaa-Pro aminopeptidase [Haloferax elongans ATCC BAA-1513]|uniref:Xaa-Pro aminopeptidase n=1 Tax=Haloferax elongans ATCC BAA-1513 TaxID=1230453 RepID=M0HSI8_HALEO|nr:M24 family metallopeptidase [Haloferax elongans]ELZ87540.1 Xaa-Pro aminopeptidase [Haloferax elongans ATCC BAA-1513]